MKVAYSEAVKSLNLVLCNNISKFDDSVESNCLFEVADEEGNTIHNIHQYYFTDADKFQVEKLLKKYPNLLFSYSSMLDIYILCVPHIGKSWDLVETKCLKN